jgi:hypothetical protein
VYGIYKESGGSLTKVIDSAITRPGGTENFRWINLTDFDQGDIAFFGATLTAAGSYIYGTYKVVGGTLSLVADTNTIPPGETVPFRYLGYGAIDGGEVAVWGYTYDPATRRYRYSIHIESGGVLQRMVDSVNTPVPGEGVNFAYVGPPGFDDGNLVFYGYYLKDSSYKYGLFWKSAGSSLRSVIKTDDTLDGKTVRQAWNYYGKALSGDSVVFNVVFTDGSRGIYAASSDLDGDGVRDKIDNCKSVPNPGQEDTGGDPGVGDACEDQDSDGVLDVVDNCTVNPNPGQEDADGDGVGDVCDNCAAVVNFDQADLDTDGVGDLCDPNKDNDTVLDVADNCPAIPNLPQADLDGDGEGDLCDADKDGDGIGNAVDGIFSAGFVDQSEDGTLKSFTDQHLGGVSFGEILTSGGLIVTVNDAANQDSGLQVDVTGGTGSANLGICDIKPPKGRVKLTNGDSVVVTCGSLKVEPFGDPVEVELLEAGIVVTIPIGAATTITETTADKFAIQNPPESPEPTEVTAGGTTVTISSGATVEITKVDEGYDIENTDDSGAPVIVTVGGQETTLQPGESGLPVVIDIKPGTFPNSINLGSGGKVPVAILSTAGFGAITVDPTTVTLASAPVKLKGKGTPMASVEDVNGDGLDDLVVHVDTSTFVLSDTDQLAVLEGTTFGGQTVMGTDSIRVVP